MFEVIWDSWGAFIWEWVRLWTDAEGFDSAQGLMD